MADLATPVTLFTAATSAQLADPPAAWAGVEHWRGQTPADFYLEIWGAASITALKLVGAVAKSLTGISVAVNAVTAGADTLTITGHPLRTGDTVQLTTSGTLPAPLALLTTYVVGVVDANTVKLFTSRSALLAAGSVAAATAIDITDAGSGTHTVVSVAASERLHWLSTGLCGPLADGAVTTTAAIGWCQLAKHRQRHLAYALVGTLGSGTPNAALQFAAV